MYFTDAPMPASRRRRYTRDGKPDEIELAVQAAIQPILQRLLAVEQALILLAGEDPNDPDADPAESATEPTDDEGVDDRRLLSNANGALDPGNTHPQKGDSQDTADLLYRRANRRAQDTIRHLNHRNRQTHDGALGERSQRELRNVDPRPASINTKNRQLWGN